MMKLVRLALRRETGIWLLMTAALACLPWALRREAPDAAFTLLLPAMLVGATGSYVLCQPSLRGKRLAGLLAATGILFLYARIGQLGLVLGGALWQSVRLAAALMLPSGGLSPTQLAAIPSWLSAQAQAGTEIAAFGQRAAAWLVGILRGQVIDDPSSRALVLAIGLWLLAVWAGARLRLNDDPLGALLPSTAALAFTLNQTVQDRWPLWLQLGALLLLLSATHLSRLLRRWRSAHTDYSDSIAEDSLLGGLILVLLVLSTAFAVSTFSLDDFLDRFRRQETTSSAASDASGYQRPGSGVAHTGGASGLQSAHLITAGPSLSKDVVMYIRTGDLPPMPPTVPIEPVRYYWRGQTYQRYNGHAWSNLTRTDVPLTDAAPILESVPQGYRKVHAVVEAPAGVNGLVYWTGTLIDADLPLNVAWRLGTGSNPAKPGINAPHNVDLIGAFVPDEAVSPSLNKYAFDAVLPEAAEAQLQSAPQTYPAWVIQQYTQLPDSVPERVRALARDITVRGRTPYDRAVAIERYLRLIPYSLDVPAPPSTREATDYFLFDLKKGYCDYYATAMTVLARAAGLPARLVTGYTSGSYDSYGAEYVVREADAHSWSEIYFSGIGWIEFEPTASQPLPHRETVQAAAPSPSGGQPVKPKWYVVPSLDLKRLRLAWLLLPLLAGSFGVYMVVDGLRLRWMAVDAAVSTIYRRLRRSTRRLGGTPTPGETAREHAAAVARGLSLLSAENRMACLILRPVSDWIAELSDLYMRSLFAPAPLGEQDVRRATRLWFDLRWRLALVNVLVAFRSLFSRRRSGPSTRAA